MITSALDLEYAMVQPSTSADIEYRAYSRPYDDGTSEVLSLFASCSYGTGQWEVFFSGNGDGTYTLMEKVPKVTNQMITYYSASFTTGVGVETPGDSVVIRDKHGAHTVAIQSMSSLR